ncbi:MAG: lipopolysaccharide biosynthesis protein [Armatimonadota bacterium]
MSASDQVEPAVPSIREGLRAFGRDVWLYWAQNALLRIGQFALLPVYLAYLRPEDFGTLALAAVYGALVGVVLGLGLDASILRFFHEWPHAERRRRLGTVWVFSALTALLLTGLLDLLSRSIAGVLVRQIPYEPYLRLTLWTAFLTTFEAVPIALLRVRQESARYMAFAIGAFVLKEALKVYAIVALGRGALGVIEAGLWGAAILAVVYVTWMARQAQPGLTLDDLRVPLRFSLPRIPGGLLETLSTVVDRIVLDKFIPIAQLGGYEVARRFGHVVRDANAPLKMAWVPYAIRLAIERRDAPRLLARMSSYYLALILTFGVGIALVSKELILLFGSGQYGFAAAMIPFFVALFLLDAVFALLGTNLYIAQKTAQVSLAATMSFAVLLASSLVLVPRLGIPGAFAALFLYRLSHGIILLSVANRHYPVPYEWRRIAWMVAGAAAVFALGWRMEIGSAWVSLMVKGALAVGFGLLAGFAVLDGPAVYAIVMGKDHTGLSTSAVPARQAKE